MNIFLPYEKNVVASIRSLDDLRLNKQILECYQLLCNALKEKNGEEIKGYKNHPIYLHYKDNLQFLCEYGLACCNEYKYRFKKDHKLFSSFVEKWKSKEIPKRMVCRYTPFYMEGSIGQSNYIRTIENVSELFQKKLCIKWENDKIKSNGKRPTWTNRQKPNFYKEK